MKSDSSTSSQESEDSDLGLKKRIVGFRESKDVIRGVKKDGSGAQELFFNKPEGIAASIGRGHKPKLILGMSGPTTSTNTLTKSTPSNSERKDNEGSCGL